MKTPSRIFVMFLLLAACFQLRAQEAFPNGIRPQSHPSPTEDDSRNASWLTWASNTETYHMMSLTNPTPYFAMQRFATADLASYNGMQLTKVKFLPSSVAEEPTIATYTIVVYTGGYYYGSYSYNDPGTLVTSQVVNDITYGEWKTVTLNNPVTINSSQELWIGVYVNATQGYAMSHDDGSAVVGKGNIMGYEGYWGEPDEFLSGADIRNWNIAGCVSDGTEESSIDLSIKFINNGISQTEISSLNVAAGSNFRPVIVVHNNNNIQADQDFTDTVFIHGYMDDVPFSEHILAHDTLESGRGVWFNIMEMQAPEVFAAGYCGSTHTFCYEISTSSAWNDADLTNNRACLALTFGDYDTYYHISVLNTDGTIAPDSIVTIYAGGNQRFVITPPDSMIIDQVFVDGTDATANVTTLVGIGKTYTFSNVQSNHTLQVTYKLGTDTSNVNITDLKINNLHIYPNPASSELNIENANGIQEVRIYDMEGREVFHSAVNETFTTINTSGLHTGMYILHAVTANGVERKCFVKR